jgi:hypothetical protein
MLSAPAHLSRLPSSFRLNNGCSENGGKYYVLHDCNVFQQGLLRKGLAGGVSRAVTTTLQLNQERANLLAGGDIAAAE